MSASVSVWAGNRSRIWVAPSSATWWRVIGKPINSKVGSSAAAAQPLSSMTASEDWPKATIRTEWLFVCADATPADVNTTAAASIAVFLRAILFSIPKVADSLKRSGALKSTCRQSPHRTYAEWTLSIGVEIVKGPF